MKKCLLVFLAVILSSVIISCGNSNYSLNSNKEQSLSTTEVASVPCQCQTAAILAWNKISRQSLKDSALYNIAMLQYTNYVTPLQCKGWIQDRVFKASGLTLPLNASNLYSWVQVNSTADSWVCGNIVARSTLIQNARFMDIIQMKLTLSDGTISPHTAFVFSTDASGMTWLDCNWDYKHTPCFVTIHYITYASFTSMAGSNYTIYHVD
jgi:hypothetical protein